MSEKKKMVPQLRFPGFSGEWEERKSNEIFYSVSDKNHPELTVLSASQEFGMVRRDEIGINIKYDKKSTQTYKRVVPGQFVIHLRSFQGGFAYANIEGITSPAYTILDFKEKEKHYPFFWREVLTGKNFIKRLESVTYGIRDGRSISFSDFSTLKFRVPSYDEQKVIGTYLVKLDHLITLHQRQLTHLQTRKKGLLQQMFPKDGELFPELRFPGFTDAWEVRKLGDVTNSFSGGTPSVGKSSYYNGEIPFIRSAEINSKSTELFISQEGLNSSSAKIVNVGDILYALYGATSGEVGIAQIEGAINQAILAIQPKENYASQFIMQWLGGQKQRIIDRFLQGGQGNLSGSIVKDLLIEFPKYQEQQKIGAFFKQLDDSITLHQRKLDHLQDRKKALLQQMFV